MEELIVNQHKYISSKRAHELTGYARDYIGQLIRQGKVEAKRVGRAWYVSEQGIRRIAEGSTPAAVVPVVHTAFPAYAVPLVPHTIERALTKTWSEIKYLPDDRPLLPISDSRVPKAQAEIPNEINALQGSRDAERVRVTVVQPKRMPLSVPAEESFSGVRLPRRSHERKPLQLQGRSSTQLSARTVGVLVGAFCFILLIPFFA